MARLGTIDLRGIEAGTEQAARAIRYATKYITKDLVDPGVQPDKARYDLEPGRCPGKVHQRKTLGYTGRRCLVSRNWSGKTLTDHRLDGRDWFRAVTAGILDDGQDQAAGEDRTKNKHRCLYILAKRGDREVDPLADRIFRAIAARDRARLALRIARDRPSLFRQPRRT